MDTTVVDAASGLAKLFPNLSVETVELIGVGYETQIFSFVLPEGKRILRLYPTEIADAKAAWEFEIMRWLREAGYPVPQVRSLLVSNQSPFGKPMLTMDWVDGHSLEQEFWSGPESERTALQRRFYGLLAQLHRLDSADPPDRIDEVAYLEALTKPVSNLFESLLTWLRTESRSIPFEPPCLVHGDFHRNNVLVSANGDFTVIDWSNCRAGDFRSDLAWIRLLTKVDDLRLYEEVSGRHVERIDYFEVLAATKILISTLLSLRFGPETQGMRPEARGLMMRNPEFFLQIVGLVQHRTGLALDDLKEVFEAQMCHNHLSPARPLAAE